MQNDASSIRSAESAPWPATLMNVRPNIHDTKSQLHLHFALFCHIEIQFKKPVFFLYSSALKLTNFIFSLLIR